MESLEKLRPLDPTMHGSSNGEQAAEEIVLQLQVPRFEVVARALKVVWQELELGGEPLLFVSPSHGRLTSEHHPLLLDMLIANGKKRKRTATGQLASWQRLEPPANSCGIAATRISASLLTSNMLHQADAGARNVVPTAPYGWMRYTFAAGWSALSTYYYDNDPNESGPVVLVALPEGRQDEWLAMLALLDDIHAGIARRARRGRIEIIGGDDDLVEVIKKTTFDDLILPEETLSQVAAQRRIFSQQILRRYATLHVPRLRKVLLIGPPGTGKTTLLKAEGALHAKQGGLVFYVCAPPKNRGASSWQQLSYALHNASESKLPTLVLVEDFEMFVSDPHELQLVLNTLDGVATPDNPSGTLLLATSNDPERIDPRIRDRPGRVDVLIEIGLVEDLELAKRFLQRFLGTAYREEEHAAVAEQFLQQPGSHFREVCIAGAMHALEVEREEVLKEDLLWAHETILRGRALAAQGERFLPPAARRKGGFFGKSRER